MAKKKQKEEAQKEQDLTMTEDKVTMGKVTFSFTLTSDEADAVLKRPKGQIARNLRKYMNAILVEACKRFDDNYNNKIVTDCKEKEKEA